MARTFFKTLVIAFVLLLVSGLVLISSCKKEGNTATQIGSTALSTTINGKIQDIDGNPISGTTISNGNTTVMSNVDGTFTLSNASFINNKCYITAKKQGFLESSKWVVGAQQAAYTVITLDEGVTYTVDANSGGKIIMYEGGEITFPTDAFEDANGQTYTGSVNIAASYLNPDDENFSLRIPGGDLIAKTALGQDAILYSYGMIRAEITDNAGNKLELKQGKGATLSFTISSAQQNNAPLTIPLWYFDENEGIWKEEGLATLTGNKYIGKVAHFSSWNVDKPMPKANVEGRVEDCNKQPQKNIPIKIGQLVTYTADDGSFSVDVPALTQLNGQVSTTFNSSYVKTISINLKENEKYNIGIISVDCVAKITGIIKDCNNELFEGRATINWGGVDNTYFVEKGVLSIELPETVKSGDIKFYSFFTLDLSKKISFSFPSGKEIIDLGTVDVCNLTLTNYFQEATFNGEGYVNTKIKMAAPATPTSSGLYYSASKNSNYYKWPFLIAQPVGDNLFVLEIFFTDSTTKTISLDLQDSLNTMTIGTGGYIYKAISGTLKISEYGRIFGTPFKAEFSGSFGRYSSTGILQGTIQVTEGKVVHARGMDRW